MDLHFRPLVLSILSFTLSITVLYSCSNSARNSDQKNISQLDTLQKEIDQLKPGFGEIMSGIQQHHAKLWFAGINENWGLTKFEVDEIEENIDKIKALYPDDPRTKELSMINPALDSLNAAINAKEIGTFKRHFTILTNTCNDCHRDNGYAFNVITIPNHPPVPNQQFKLDKKN